ncbi:MAG: hypothetical protein ACT4P6_20960 [Gemmatimonadaceae bacterium]
MRFASWILSRLLAEPDKEAVLGDLAEERALRLRRAASPNDALWYWSQISRSVPPLAWAALRRRGWINIIGAGIAAYALMTVVQSAGQFALTKLLAAVPGPHMVFSLAFTIAAMILGGYVAVYIRRGAAAIVAIISTLSVVDFIIRTAGQTPLWLSVMWLLVCPLTALAGGALVRVRRTDPSST